MDLKVIDNKGQESGTVQFDETVFPQGVSPALLHEVITAYRASQRSGTHSTKTRSEVSGGGLKPWKQKGTGRARAGSTRSPLWRHGGIIFGPRPRDYSQQLPQKKRRIAFGCAVRELFQDERLQVVEPIQIPEPKTKHVSAVLKKWSVPTDSLYVVDKLDPLMKRAARNISTIAISDVATLNTYDCLRARRVFITKDALEKLSNRIKKSKGS